MTIKILNYFSLKMIKENCSIKIKNMNQEDVTTMLKDQPYVSCVDNEDTARVLSNELGVNVDENVSDVSLYQEDVVLVVMYEGLDERDLMFHEKLPEGSGFSFMLLEVV